MSFSFATFLSVNLISSFCTQFQLFALNFSFLHCLGLIDMLSANQHGKIFACILLYLKSTPTLVIIRINYTKGGKFTRPRTARTFLLARLQSACRTNYVIWNYLHNVLRIKFEEHCEHNSIEWNKLPYE